MVPESKRNSQRKYLSSNKIPVSAPVLLFGSLCIAPLLMTGTPLRALSCTTQASLQAADREALLTAGNVIAGSVSSQNYDALQASLLPSVSGDWESIRGVAQGAAPLLKGGKLAWGDGYLLDATDLKAPSDAQFFCTNTESSVTMTVSLRSLPAGKYALLIGDYEGAPMAGQIALILGTDATANGNWKLGGLFVREGAFNGHDGIWYWRRARELAAKKPGNAANGQAGTQNWPAWFSYDAARWLLLPVDFLSSPHLEKLNSEQSKLAGNPQDTLPLFVSAEGAKTAKITGIRLDDTLHTDDLGLTYEGSGITEPQAAKAEAIAVMSGLLKLHPELRENFHGLWAYAEQDGRRSYAIELPMKDIP
jgi:hypothetical protein